MSGRHFAAVILPAVHLFHVWLPPFCYIFNNQALPLSSRTRPSHLLLAWGFNMPFLKKQCRKCSWVLLLCYEVKFIGTPPAVRHLQRGWTTSSFAIGQRTHFRITSSTETLWGNEVRVTVQSQSWRHEVGHDVRSQQAEVNMLGRCLYLRDLLWGGLVKARLVSPVNGWFPCLALLYLSL